MCNNCHGVNVKDAFEECHDLAMSLAYFYDGTNNHNLSRCTEVEEDQDTSAVKHGDPQDTESI